jgi:hypothetical protein
MHIVHKKSHNPPLLHITSKKASYIQGPNDVKDGILTQSYIIQIKNHNIIQCLLLIQQSQYERDAITKKIRKDYDNIKRLSKFNNI